MICCNPVITTHYSRKKFIVNMTFRANFFEQDEKVTLEIAVVIPGLVRSHAVCLLNFSRHLIIIM